MFFFSEMFIRDVHVTGVIEPRSQALSPLPPWSLGSRLATYQRPSPTNNEIKRVAAKLEQAEYLDRNYSDRRFK